MIAAVSAPALAWEYEMTGEHEYRWRYLARTGNNDLFGLAGAQETTGVPVGFAGINSWNTGAIPAANAIGGAAATFITRGGFSTWESDALYVDQRLTFVPTFRVNQAIRVHGMYNVGGFRNMYNMSAGGPNLSGVGVPPFERYMPNYTSDSSAMSTAALGSWEQVRATVQVPWGILSYGMKDFPFGIGLFSSQRLRGSSFVFIAPYGPMRFIGAIWELSSTVNGSGTFNFRPDATNKNTWFGALGFTYEAGPLSIGGIWVGQNFHRNAANDTPGGFPAVTGSLGSDRSVNLFSFSTKYNSGRFFANLGYDWATLDTANLRPTGGFAPPAAPNLNFLVPGAHVEQYHLMAEVGALAGPAKVSLMWAQSSGPVLNDNSGTYSSLGYGALGISRNPNVLNGFNPKTYAGWGIDWQAMEPYQYLMFGVYAGGNQTFSGLFLSDDTHGMMSDAYTFAGRVDYAVASNLNVYGTYLWAHRLEAAGTFMGQYASTGASTTIATADTRANFRGNIGAGNDNFERYVPNGYLGWEMTLGMDWKLLEGLTLRTRYAYWQPGDWFTYAYQTIMPGQPFGPGPIIGVGVPYSVSGFLGSRDAIQAFEGSLFINF
jgi:hypothetical protein